MLRAVTGYLLQAVPEGGEEEEEPAAIAALPPAMVIAPIPIIEVELAGSRPL